MPFESLECKNLEWNNRKFNVSLLVYSKSNSLNKQFLKNKLNRLCKLGFQFYGFSKLLKSKVHKIQDDLFATKTRASKNPKKRKVNKRMPEIIYNCHEIRRNSLNLKQYLLIVKILIKTKSILQNKFAIEIQNLKIGDRLNEFEKVIIASYFDLRR